MGAEYDADTRWRAMELYCADRLTFAQVSEATGIADSTLRRWADAYQWRERREELAKAEADIRIDTIRSRAAILKHLLEAEDGKAASQIAFAVASLGNLELQYQKALLAGEIANPAKPEKSVKVSSRAEAIAVLKQAVEDKLGLLLSDKKYVTRRQRHRRRQVSRAGAGAGGYVAQGRGRCGEARRGIRRYCRTTG